MLFDPRTLLFATSVVLVVCALCMTFLWSSNRTEPGAGYWAVQFSFAALGVALVAARGMVPDFLSVTVANPVLLVSYLVFLSGIRVFAGRAPINIGLIVIAFVAAFILFDYFVHTDPNVSIRIGLHAIFVIGTHITIAVVLLQNSKADETARRLLALVVSIHAATYVAVLAHVLSASSLPSLLDYRDVVVLTSIEAIAFVIFTAVFLALMIGQRYQTMLSRQAILDPLTEVLNRRGFMLQARRELARRDSTGKTAVLAIADLDHFKSVNDRFGHQAGDVALVQFVGTARRQLRETDLIGRMGGEEFALMIFGIEERPALALLERLRGAVARTPVLTMSTEFELTVSIGAVVIPDAQLAIAQFGIEKFMHAADTALYVAKTSGRNQVHIAQPPTVPEIAAPSMVSA